MTTIFDDVFASERKRKPSEIQAWMRSIREAETTGVLRLINPPDERIILHHYRGNWISSHPSMGGATEMDLANDIPVNGDMYMKFIPLSTHGLIHSNLLTCAEFQQQESGSPTSEPLWTIENSSKRPDPYLVKMKWENAAGSILFNGVSQLPHSLFISENLILDEPGISTSILQRQGDPACVVTLFSPDPALDVWQELHLRRAFKLLCDRMLERFESIAGRAIVESFTRVISAFTSSEELDISILKRQLVNNEFFRSSQDAAGHYTLILNEFLAHFSAVIGSRLLSSNLREIYTSLSPDIRETLKSHNILPEEYIL